MRDHQNPCTTNGKFEQNREKLPPKPSQDCQPETPAHGFSARMTAQKYLDVNNKSYSWKERCEIGLLVRLFQRPLNLHSALNMFPVQNLGQSMKHGLDRPQLNT